MYPLYLYISYLTYSAFLQYAGEGFYYLFFTVCLNLLLFLGFRKGRIFFDTFIGIFFWLGFWLKYTVRTAYMNGQFYDVGHFNGSGGAHDKALLVTSIGVLGLISASLIRERFVFSYSGETQSKMGLDGLFQAYRKHRKLVWLGFAVLIITVATTNAYLGIYQRGSVPRTTLPFKLKGVYTWILLFGGASVTAVLADFEMRLNHKSLYPVVGLGLLESFFSSTSMLSRGMVLNVSALGIGGLANLKRHNISLKLKFLAISVFCFIILFTGSVVIVNHLRSIQYTGTSENIEINEIAKHAERTKILFIDRWVGIEGMMAVSGYPGQGWNLFKKGLNEKYSERGTSFYDSEIISSYYVSENMMNHHFISLPGILAFVYYSGSVAFVFIAMFTAGIFAAAIEVYTHKFSDSSFVLCALLAQVVAYRYAHFGYVPKQSYLLFGAIFLNVMLIFLGNKLLLFVLNRRHA